MDMEIMVDQFVTLGYHILSEISHCGLDGLFTPRVIYREKLADH